MRLHAVCLFIWKDLINLLFDYIAAGYSAYLKVVEKSRAAVLLICRDLSGPDTLGAIAQAEDSTGENKVGRTSTV